MILGFMLLLSWSIVLPAHRKCAVQYHKKLKEFIEDGEGDKNNIDSISASVLERTSVNKGEPKIPLGLFVHNPNQGESKTENTTPAVP